MANDTDLDALIREHRHASVEFWINNSVAASRRRMDAAEAALRARLAPPTHAEDEALVQAVVETSPAFERASSGAFPNGYDISDDVAAHNASTEALRRRLAELRARAETQERIANDFGNAMQGWCDKAAEQQTRAEAAEAALAEYRAALAEYAKVDSTDAKRMRLAIVEARQRLAKGRGLWNGPCHECDAVLAQALTVNNYPADINKGLDRETLRALAEEALKKREPRNG